MKQLIVILGLFLIVASIAKADDRVNPCHYSTEGTDFWFGFMQNRIKGVEHYLEITVTSRNGADLTLTYGPDEILIGKYTVAANSSFPIPIEYSILEPSGSEIAEDKGIHLISTDSVNVYALNYRTMSSDVAVIYPTKSLGKEYFAMSYTPHPTGTVESNSELLIVASEENTIVNITPTVDTDRGRKANTTFQVMLNKGQTYQVQSMNTKISGQGDLTGSYISSDQPIAFYSGAKSTAVPYEGPSRDYLLEQIPPTTTWGREFYIVPLELREKDTYRILAAEDETIINVDGLNRTLILQRGEYSDFDLTRNQACRVKSSKKVLLAQYCRSQEADNKNGVGDPFMIILSPISQNIRDITFEAYETKLVSNIFYVNIITLTSEKDNITLDESGIGTWFKAFPNSKYSYAQVKIKSGTHRLKNHEKDGGFLAYVYGFGDNNNTESYGYGVGFNLDIQLDIGGSFDVSNDTLVTCPGSEIKLEAGEYFVSYEWSTGEKTSSIQVLDEKWYSVTATTLAGCIKTDQIYLKVDHPKIDLGPDVSVCLPGEYVINAKAGFKSYRWQNGTEGSAYRVDSTGNYSVIVTNQNGCEATDTVYVEVSMPRLGFTPDYSVVTIEHPEITFNNTTRGDLEYSWDFGDGASSTERSPKHQFPGIRKYHVVMKAINDQNCVDKHETDVEVVPFTFFIPNAFRPDSDIPENRLFLPSLSAVDPTNYNFEVFNRIGSSIFQTSNPNTGWDGQNAEQGIFVWIVKYSDIQGYKHSQKGTVMLVR